MMYTLYQLQSDLLSLPRDAAARLSRLTVAFDQATGVDAFRPLRAGCELFTRFNFRHTQPPFCIDSVMVEGREVSVSEEVTLSTAFGTLLHFRKHCADSQETMPKVLVVAPLSGHFSTLLRDTVRVLLPDHDVYITNWHNARDVGRAAGRFGFE